MDGLDVLKAIRERHPGVETIMLTGHGTIDTAIDSIRLGAFDYVIKPCPLDELQIRIQRALERRSLRHVPICWNAADAAGSWGFIRGRE